MKNIYILVLVIFAMNLGRASDNHTNESDSHQHGEKENFNKGKKEEHKHAEGESHEEVDDHGEEDGHNHAENEKQKEEEEGGQLVGPEKGVIERGPLGFKLSPEAQKNFEIEIITFNPTLNSKSSQPWLVKIKDGKYAYRTHDGWIKRVKIEQLKSGDQVVSKGTGYIRGAELVLEQGASHGHSH